MISNESHPPSMISLMNLASAMGIKNIKMAISPFKLGIVGINRCQQESPLAILVAYIITLIAIKTTNMAAAAMT